MPHETEAWARLDAETEEWLRIRRHAPRELDSDTAEVSWWWEQICDPYRVYPDFPEELDQVGRTYYARAPGSDVWVWFGDLPDATAERLWEKHRNELAFPQGNDAAILAMNDNPALLAAFGVTPAELAAATAWLKSVERALTDEP